MPLPLRLREPFTHRSRHTRGTWPLCPWLPHFLFVLGSRSHSAPGTRGVHGPQGVFPCLFGKHSGKKMAFPALLIQYFPNPFFFCIVVGLLCFGIVVGIVFQLVCMFTIHDYGTSSSLPRRVARGTSRPEMDSAGSSGGPSSSKRSKTHVLSKVQQEFVGELVLLQGGLMSVGGIWLDRDSNDGVTASSSSSSSSRQRMHEVQSS